MKLKAIITIPIMILSGFSFGQSLSPQVVSSSGNTDASLCWTLGQISISTISANNLILTQGFQQGEYSVTTSIENASTSSANTIFFFPNPTKGLVNISSTYEDEQNIQLFDNTGKLLYSSKFQEKTQIDLSNFAENTYLLKINNQTFKIVKH